MTDDTVTFLCGGGTCEVIRAPAEVDRLADERYKMLAAAYRTTHGDYPDSIDAVIPLLDEAVAWAEREHAERQDVARRRAMMRQSAKGGT